MVFNLLSRCCRCHFSMAFKAHFFVIIIHLKKIKYLVKFRVIIYLLTSVSKFIKTTYEICKV